MVKVCECNRCGVMLHYFPEEGPSYSCGGSPEESDVFEVIGSEERVCQDCFLAIEKEEKDAE